MGQPEISEIDPDRIARVSDAVDVWVKQLVDLTGRNQLLYYRTLKRGTLELTEAEPAGISTLLADGQVRLSNLIRVTDDDPDRLEDAVKRARTIHGKALTYFEERGIDTLFLVYGMASWTTASSSATPQAPVLLRPLRFAPRGASEIDFDVSLHGDWDVNETLLHLLATEYRVSVEKEGLLELFVEDDPDPARLYERLFKECAEIPNFEIQNRLVAGTFAYTKLPMVKDLQENVEALVRHDIISAVAGDEGAQRAVREMRATDVEASLPDRTPPADEFLILDADASQNLAINAAIAGEPLIIQGPPGTGKSQTIANLIAATTARGQHVLFVAEKRAAIDAVTKRLHKVGLGDLVMDLHGGVTSKRQLAADLAHTLDDMARIPKIDATELHHSLVSSRTALTEYAEALHEVRDPWGVSIFDVNRWLIGLGPDAERDLRFSGSRLSDLDETVVRQAREHLIEWSSLSQPLITGRSPWTGAEVTSDTDAKDVLDLVDELSGDTVPTARARLDGVLEETMLPSPDSVEEWQRTLGLLSGVSRTLSQFDHTIFDLKLAYLSAALAPAGRGRWARIRAQLFDDRYRLAKHTVRDVWTSTGKPNGKELHEAVEEARKQAEQWRTLGGLGRPRLPGGLDQAEDSYEQLTDELAALGAFLVTKDLRRRSHRQVQDDVRDLLADQQTLFRLPRIHELEVWLQRHHLAPLMDSVRRGDVDSAAIVDVLDHAWLSSIRTQVTASDPRLANFDGNLQDARVEQFRRSDREHLEVTAVRVRRAIAERATAIRSAYPEQDQLVRKEAHKKSRHMTLRRLFESAPDVLTALRPCWTMSPLVVSQILPAEPIFDLVIFDEASQVLPADAVPALLRAPIAVVAGDRRQLPPTTFFDSSAEDEDVEETEAALTVGFESILDVLDALLPNRMLTWHYRSEDERLIAFSNHNIYDSSLTTFPGASAERCLDFELIPHRLGVPVDTRSSDPEVSRVVDLMIEHAGLRPEESLGVIAMGQYHASRIEAALRDRLTDDRSLAEFFDETREERAFVKNLERVQGDERDVIILSVGYGKQADGRLLYRFGPLNQQGGERRLNVAVTRARRRLTVVSSFSHIEMNPSRSSAEGVELLRRYLKYAESGGVDLDGAEANTPLNPFEIDVKHRLEQAGLDVVPQYGTSGFRVDFAIPHPTLQDRFALAIEADGASYHSAQTARDRDRLRQEVLERLGWRFHRIWSTDWFNDPGRETEKAVAAYEHAVIDIERGERTVHREPESTSVEPTTGYDRPRRSGYRPRIIPGASIGDYDHSQLVGLARWIQSDTLLRTEEQMLQEMMDQLGFSRRGSRIVEALTRAIRSV